MLNSREFSNMVRKIQTISKATLKATEEKNFLVKKTKKKFLILQQNMKDTFIICASLCILLTPIQILAFYFCPTTI